MKNPQLKYPEIVFGMELDGSSWSRESSVNCYACGPLGLLKYIETRFGRTAKETDEAVRIGAYQDKIRVALATNPELWCARSFAADAWSTTKQMLQWRDQILELKRDLSLPSGVSRRFDDLVAIEAAGNPLPEGIADRVLALLKTDRHIGTNVNLVTHWEDLPRLWYDLIAANFDAVSEWGPERPLPQIEIVRAHDEVALAREFARWVAADKESNKDATLIVEGDSSLLDAELRALGLPAIGNAVSSASRKTLQILPDKIAAIWSGREIDLAATEAEVGAALDAADCELSKCIERDELAQIARKHVSTMRSLLAGGKAFKRAQLLRLLETVVGNGCVRPGNWNEVGCPRVIKSPEALFTLSENDKLHPRSKYTLWWDFTARPSAAPIRLTEKEKAAVGEWVVRHDAEAMRRRELSGWRLPLSNTVEKLILFAPYVKNGENAALHPLYDYLSKKLGKDENGEDRIKAMTKDAAELVDADGVWHLGGRAIDSLEKAESPCRHFEDAVNISTIDHFPETVSQSQMETMISCPFAWYCKHYLELEPSEAAKDETIELRTGSHAHKVVEELVNLGVKNVQGVETNFERIFEATLPKYLAEYLEPEAVAKKTEYRTLLLASIKKIFEKIEADGLSIVGCEEERSEEGFHGSRLHGYIDMLLTDKDGRNVIFDFKWSRGRTRFEEMIKEGKSIQFAVYHHLLGGDTKCYYYLFPLMRFIEDTQDNVAVFKNVEDSYALRLGQIMKGIVKKAIVTGLETSTAEDKRKRAAEIAAEGLTIDLPAKCLFCGYNELCGKARKSKENWK